MTGEVLDHASTDMLVLQWRVIADEGAPGYEWFDTQVKEDRKHGQQDLQIARMLREWQERYPADDEEQRVVVRISHITDYATDVAPTKRIDRREPDAAYDGETSCLSKHDLTLPESLTPDGRCIACQ